VGAAKYLAVVPPNEIAANLQNAIQQEKSCASGNEIRRLLMAVSIFHRALIGAMQHAPESLVWRFSKRYIAGSTLQDAYDTVRNLNNLGCKATIDLLGEDSDSDERVNAARDVYIEALNGIEPAGLDCNISVKLSDMGLRLNASRCTDVVRELASCAKDNDNFVRIDMEDSSVTSVTLDVYRELRKNFDNVGVVLQSCLRRTEADVAELLQGGPTNIRICKGIYIEPEAVAFQDADEIRNSYQQILQQLLEGGATRVGIATHDPILINQARETIGKLGISRDRYEFQMLLGVAEHLRNELVQDGHPLRVYVPFGELWFKYSMRRLAENPNIAGHIVRNLFRRN
jgi:proline dehydrogenase